MTHAIKTGIVVVLTGLCNVVYANGTEEADYMKALNNVNVVWNSPSEDVHGSMPIGNGDLAANVWIEPNGDLLFYLSKSDSWSGHQELLKLGRVRVHLDPPLYAEGLEFRQELDLASGTIKVQSSSSNLSSSILFWIDANNPVVNVEIKGAKAFSAKASLEVWRTEDAQRYGWAEPDTVLPAEGDAIRWYQRNKHSIFSETLKNQHLESAIGTYPDPLMNLTFGGLIEGGGLKSEEATTLVTEGPVQDLHLRVHALTARTDTPEEWIEQLESQRETVERIPVEVTREQHKAYWADFWNRSYIMVSGSADADAVTRAYMLQRWIQACAGRGKYPIKFNGSLFTVDYVDLNHEKNLVALGPDARKWGGCYWFQNTREPYWAMLYSGDYDQMEPLWRMYRDALPLLKERTRRYFQHDGIFCSETMHPWGLNRGVDFGAGNEDFYPTSPFIRYYWDSGLELSMMMQDCYAHTQEKFFATNTLIPIADEVVKFYDQHHPRTEQGQVQFSPAASLETWHSAEDPLPVVVGLRTVLTQLLELPETLTTPEQRARWKRFRSELPETPIGEEDGKRWLEPAHSYSACANSENPELYAVFPYRAYGLGKPDLDVSLETWQRRRIKRTGGWTQDPIQAAMLGLTQEAKDYVVKNATDRAPIVKPVREPRFPAFWGPNFDWLPDQCHGSVTMIALQRMLMLCDPSTGSTSSPQAGSGQAGTIRLLPAWPDDWDADFKLHAPGRTTVEGRVENGKLVELHVVPASRRKDVIVGENTSSNDGEL